MRRTALTAPLLIAGLTLTGATDPAMAHEGAHCGEGSSDLDFTCQRHTHGSGGGSSGGGGSSSGGGQPSEIWTTGIGTHPDTGEDCWAVVQGGTMTWAEAYRLIINAFDQNGRGLDACPLDQPSPVPSAWETMSCPPPLPTPVTTNPDRAAAGMPTYLTIGGSNPVGVGCLGETITATARYVIHWGDGTTTETSSQGGSWADGGDVHHTYTDAGDVTIRVEAYWTGSWNGITFPELPVPTQASIPLGIDSYQSVRTR